MIEWLCIGLQVKVANLDIAQLQLIHHLSEKSTLLATAFIQYYVQIGSRYGDWKSWETTSRADIQVLFRLLQVWEQVQAVS